MSALVIDFAEHRAAIRARRHPFDPYGLVIPAALLAGAAFWIFVGWSLWTWGDLKMADYSWLTDEQLERRVEELRRDAHKAPKGGPENNGSFAWATRGNDWLSASLALDRRRAKIQQ